MLDAAALGLVNQLEILLGLDPTLAATEGPAALTALHLAARFGHAAPPAGCSTPAPTRRRRRRPAQTAADLATAAGHDRAGVGAQIALRASRAATSIGSHTDANGGA